MMSNTSSVNHCSSSPTNSAMRDKRQGEIVAEVVSNVGSQIVNCMNSKCQSSNSCMAGISAEIQRMNQRVVCSVSASTRVREALLRGLKGSMGLEVQQHAAGIVSVLTLQGGSSAWKGDLEGIVSSIGSLLVPQRETTPKTKERAARVLAWLSREEVTVLCSVDFAPGRSACTHVTSNHRHANTH